MDNKNQVNYTYHASPNLALVKYWGKSDRISNKPATPSLGVTLAALSTITDVRLQDSTDTVLVEGRKMAVDRFEPFFKALRTYRSDVFFHADSQNSFPTAAGLASSSSGFAALACGCAAAAGLNLSSEELSALARIGSASAARSVFGGFVSLKADAEHGEQLHPHTHWPDLRIILVAVTSAPKPTSSRKAMELSRTTSPFYESWVESSQELYAESVRAVEARDIEHLGRTMRQSYLRMFGTMFSSSPPVVYWAPDSLKVVHLCDEMRSEGIQAWETMDAGPQVKIACLEADVPEIVGRVSELGADWLIIESEVGPGPGKDE